MTKLKWKTLGVKGLYELETALNEFSEAGWEILSVLPGGTSGVLFTIVAMTRYTPPHDSPGIAGTR